MNNRNKNILPIVAVARLGLNHSESSPLPDAAGFRWHAVSPGPVHVQLREILLSNSAAVVVFVGSADSLIHAVDLLGRLCSTGPPMLVAVAEAHDVQTECLLRQTGAVYLCGRDASLRLPQLLQEMLCPIRTL